MKTLIVSSSISEKSRSFILCTEVAKELKTKDINCTIVDTRNLSIQPTHKGLTKDMQKLKKKIDEADNLIIGMGVHCYSVNDSLKILLDTCFDGATGKFFAIICAAGSDRSFLSTMHLTQICMNEWRMIQLPRIIYATKNDFTNDTLSSNEVKERIKLFSKEFCDIGKRLSY